MPEMDRLKRMYQELWDAHGEPTRNWTAAETAIGRGSLCRCRGPGGDTEWRVLDAGCGRGTHSLQLARRFRCRVVGTDAVLGPMTFAAGMFAQTLLEAIPAGDATSISSGA